MPQFNACQWMKLKLKSTSHQNSLKVKQHLVDCLVPGAFLDMRETMHIFSVIENCSDERGSN